MFLIELLIVSIVHLAVVGIDVLSFFIVIRLLVQRWPKHLFLRFDQVGRPIVDPLLASVDRAIPCAWTGTSPRRDHIGAAVTLLVLGLCRLGMTGLVRV